MPVKKTTKTVDAIEPEWTTVASKVQTDVPFRSMSNIQKAIVEFRAKFKAEPPVKRGQGTAPSGIVFNYYLSEDLVDYADAFLMSKKMFLDTETFVTGTGQTAVRFTIYDYELTEGDNMKFSEISIGSPTTIGELGSRITYAQKYLIGALFGISVATDTDAFNNGVIKQQNETNRNEQNTVSHNVVVPVVGPVGDISGCSTGDKSTTVHTTNTGTSNDTIANVSRSVAVPVESTQLEHTKSYPLAKEFIMKSLSQAMLDSAVIKVTNSVTMREDEKTELTELIATRRTEVTV